MRGDEPRATARGADFARAVLTSPTWVHGDEPRATAYGADIARVVLTMPRGADNARSVTPVTTAWKVWLGMKASRKRNHLTKGRIHFLSRSIICLVVVASFALLLRHPRGPIDYLCDIILRTYLIFVGTVMAHEGVHGHLARTKSGNFWWGRLALLPSMVPYTNFRKTHNLHHAFTNIPDRDPDHFMKSRNAFGVVLRAVAMPHQWFLWLWKRGWLGKADVWELVLNYVGIFAVYAVLLTFTGVSRMIWGMAAPLVLVSVLLWYPFAVQTHEGFSTGAHEFRSHNYYGRFMFWFSFGLGLHRVHHSQPALSWIELRDYVETAPTTSSVWRFIPRRDIRIESSES